MKRKVIRRAFLWVLSVLMVITLMPVSSLAESSYNETAKISAQSGQVEFDGKEEPWLKEIQAGLPIEKASAYCYVSIQFGDTESGSHCVLESVKKNGEDQILSGQTSGFDAEEGDTVEGNLLLEDGYLIDRIIDKNIVRTIDIIKNGNSVHFSLTVTDASWPVKIQIFVSSCKKVEVLESEYGTVTTDAGEDFIGGKVTVEARPEAGYRLQKVEYSVDGQSSWEVASMESETTAAFTTQADYTIVRAVFAEIETLVITSEAELWNFAERVNEGDSFSGAVVRLDRDIQLVSQTTLIGHNGNLSNGISECPFSGTFDGCGHSISGIEITDECLDGGYYLALFPCVRGGEIRNLTVEGRVSGSVFSAAGIAGNMQTGIVSNCENRMNISTSHSNGIIAGIVSEAGKNSVIENCVNRGTITCGFSAGGIAGNLRSDSVIHNCLNEGMVTAVNYAGGIVYSSQCCDVTGCTNKGEIRAENTDSSAYGACAAGIVAALELSSKTDIHFRDLYNTGDIFSYSRGSHKGEMAYAAGIFSGYRNNCSGIVLENCYNTGSVQRNGINSTAEERIGEIAPLKELLGNDYNGYTTQDVQEKDCSQINCYDRAGILAEVSAGSAAASLGNAFKEDEQGVNPDQTPLLQWEDGIPDQTEYSLRFEVTGEEEYSLTVYTDKSKTDRIEPDTEGVYHVISGTYPYEITAEGCVPVSGNARIRGKDTEVSVVLEKGGQVTFHVNPAQAEFHLRSAKEEQSPSRVEGNSYTYTLIPGETYSYHVNAEGYNGLSRNYTASLEKEEVSVSLTKSVYGTDETVAYVYGDGNYEDDGVTLKKHDVVQGGSYYIGEGATGKLTISTSEPVILIGSGIGDSDRYEELHIDCTKQKTDLTLQDVFISVWENGYNLIDFAGKGNILRFAGVSVLDKDSGPTGYALIHVPESAELTVTGETLYLYKREQGAGIGGNGGASNGGQEPETNGKIIIDNARIFAKASKQGALIGAGAQASEKEPGDIIIRNSDLNLINIARGAAIGGSAGSTGASSGSRVTVENSRITVNVDFSGAAIGGGGFDSGNDSDGGTVLYESGSIRTFIDYNAVDPDGDGNKEKSLWYDFGVCEPGVNGNTAVTARVVSGQDADQELALLILDTSEMEADKDGNYVVKDESGSVVYSGDLHRYDYKNARLQKNEQARCDYTVDNWVPLDDPNLYLYLTGENHTLDVNGQTVNVVWDSGSETFTVTSGETPSGPVVEDYTKNSAAPAAWSFNEEETDLTVTCSSACSVIAVAADGSCERIQGEAADTENTYSFPVPEGGSKIVIVRKGDVNRDGKLTVADAAQTKAASLGKIVPSDALQAMLLDVSGDGKVTVTDAAQVKAATLGKISFSW